MPPWLCRLLPRLCDRDRPPAPAPPPTPTAGASLPGPADLAAAINRAREARGMQALARDAGLERSAADEVAGCVAAGVLRHYDFAWRIAVVHPGIPAGEDIAAGYATPDAVVAAWMADPPHRAILLGHWDMVGGASAAGRDGTIYVAADFALGGSRWAP